MKRANRLMLIFGVILAAVSFVVVLAFGSFSQQAPAQNTTEVPVVVAAQELALGTAVTAEMLTSVNRPQTEAVDTYQYPEEVVGMVVRRQVAQGQALSSADFQTNVTMPELARSLAPGLRAVAVPLSREDSVGALLQPGDWVDALLTLEELDALNPVVMQNPSGLQPTTDGSPPIPYIGLDEYVNNTSVKVVVQNVQVLAALPPDAPSEDEYSETTVVQPDLIAVLAVTPQQAEIIRFAQMDGNISLALRSPGDYAAGAVTTTGITLHKLVEEHGVLPPLPVAP